MLLAWATFCLLLALAYCVIILYFRRQWRKLPEWHIPPGFDPQLPVSVLIPARNEAKKIGLCLESILSQTYPSHLLEIIVIDDHSTDHTLIQATRVGEARVRCLSLPPAATGKKAAITAGVAAAAGELILTTDADCRVPPDWVRLFASLYETQRPAFIAGPVHLEAGEGVLGHFQALDFTGMMLLTGAGFRSGRLLLANGANLAYPRAAFEAVGGFRGVEHYASGDDVFLLRKMLNRPVSGFSPPTFLKTSGAVVHTDAKKSWRSFLRQRLRWATKNRPLDQGLTNGTTLQKAGRVTLLTLTCTFLLSWSIVLNLLFIPLFGWPLFWLFLIGLGIKTLSDYGMLREATNFFHQEKLMDWFWPSLVLHIIYIALVGLLGNIVRRYDWKGRQVR